MFDVVAAIEARALNPADADLLRSSWQEAWTALYADPPAGLRERLIACYSEPHRRYHTVQHLGECLQHVQPALALAEHPGEVAVALWFHDAIYALRRQDNELKSARFAHQELLAAGVSVPSAERVYALVMATRHSALPETQDERLLVDVDLSILGAEPRRFDEYEAQVGEEYAWVPRWWFRRKRLEVLREFLARAPIYGSAYFRDRLEPQARLNLQRSIMQLTR